MIYGSVCSGIEAATVAWHLLGWKPAFFSEIEKFPCAVLQYHYPHVPLHGDFTTIQKDDYEPIDLLVGGTPCQSFSVAGLRGGLDDERGGLAMEFVELAKRIRARWIVWENVPGVLSSGRGYDFGAFIGALAKCGYGFAYRVLDAQYFGAPSVAVECSLLDILETTDLPQRFYLSPKACAGILRRAEKRKVLLPPSLQTALAQAAQTKTKEKPVT